MIGRRPTVDDLPLAADRDGVIRIGRTRVTLDTIVAASNRGATPEEIVRQYPALDLGDIYSAIAHYLHARDEVGNYLEGRRKSAAAVRRESLNRCPADGIRGQLAARRSASAGQFAPA
jgi:uncharacterized protein (DUF433 family)